MLLGHHDELEGRPALLDHLHHLGVGLAHDRLSVHAHHLVTCSFFNDDVIILFRIIIAT